jgi:DNA polymerase II large subunit
MIKKPVGPDIPEPVKRLFYELIDEINDINDIVQVLRKDRDKRVAQEKAQEQKKTKAEARAEAGKIKAAKKLLKEQTK